MGSDRVRSGIAAVAELAGVSVSTVSQALGGTRPVSAKTRQKVEEAARRLRYHPDPAARALRKRRTESVALVVPDITNPFYAFVAAGMNDELMDAGYLLSVCDAALPRRNLQDVLAHVTARRVDGVVLAAYGASSRQVAALADAGMSVVTLGLIDGARGNDVVRSDDVGGLRRVVEHLVDRGYRRIGFVGGEETAAPTVLRLTGYRAALEAAGREFDPALVQFRTFTREGGAAGARALLDRAGPAHHRPDAIVGGNDLIALGIIDTLHEIGLAVPGEVAVTGYDDIEVASLVTPTLTTVDNPAREMGRAAGELLLSRMTSSHPRGPSREIVVANRLVVRGST